MLLSYICSLFFLLQIVSYTADDDGYHASVVYEGEAVYDRPDHAHAHAEHAVSVIKHSLHKPIIKEADVDKLPALLHLSSSLSKIEQNHEQLTVEPFFPFSSESHPLSQPHPQAPQQAEHRYRYSPTPIPYKE